MTLYCNIEGNSRNILFRTGYVLDSDGDGCTDTVNGGEIMSINTFNRFVVTLSTLAVTLK